MSVHKDLTFAAQLPSTLTRCKQGRAVSTSLQHVLTILEQNLKLLHEDLALQLIFLVFQRV